MHRAFSDKAQSKHNESGHPPLADIRLDIAFRRSGPLAVIESAQMFDVPLEPAK